MSSSDGDLDVVEHALTRLLKKQQELSADERTLPSDLLSTLLDEVHARRKDHINEDSNSAAVKAAVAAANAAQAAADSVARNSQLVELLMQKNASESEKYESESESENSKQTEKPKLERKLVTLVRKVQRQNLVTHLILGFIVITTAVWRFKEISWILRLKKMVSNPLDVVGGIFGGDQQQQQQRQHKYKEEVETKPIQLPHIELPSLFQKTETEEKTW